MHKQKTHITKTETLNFGTIELRSDNILVFEPVEGITTLNLNELQLMKDELIRLSENTPLPFFSNNKQLKNLGTEERKFVGENIHLFATKGAITENSPIVRFITHMIIHFYKPPIPMKMFKNKDEAIEWLKQND